MLPRLALPRAVGLLGLLTVFVTSLLPVGAAPARQPQNPPAQATAAPAPLAAAVDHAVTLSSTTTQLAFEANVGQFPPATRFQVQALGGTVAFTAQSLIFTLPSQAPAPTATNPVPRPGQAVGRNPFDRRIAAQPIQSALPPAVLQQHFLDTIPTALTGSDLLPGTVSYFQGDDPAEWFTDIPTYGSLLYDALYPGIALAYHGQDSQLKSFFTVAPGADPTLIRWR